MSSPQQIDVAALAAAFQQAQQHIAAQAQQLQQLQAQQQQAAQQAHAGVGRLKAPTPPTFKGDSLAVDEFLRAQKQQHAFYGNDLATDVAKLKFVAVHLAGAAAQWFETTQGGAAPISTWAEFEERFTKRYRPVRAELSARQRLIQLKQRATTTVSAYASLFQTILSPITDMSEKDKLFLFVQGLLPAIQVRMWEKEPLTLADAINTAVSIEAMLSFGRHGVGSHGFGGGRGHHGTSAGASSSSSGGAVHMDLSNLALQEESAGVDDAFTQWQAAAEREEAAARATPDRDNGLSQRLQAIEQRLANLSSTRSGGDRVPGLKSDEIKKLMKEGRCFRCKKTGHMKSECPKNA